MKNLIAKMDALNKEAGPAQLNEDVHVIQPMEAVGEMDEATNHMGEREYESFHGWKAACRKAGAEWFDGDRDICNAMKGPHPYQRGITQQVGEWDGAVGSVYNNEPALGESQVNEAVDTASDLAKLARVIKSVKTKEQYEAAKKYADLMWQKLNGNIVKSKGFAGLGDSTDLMSAIQSDLRQLRKRLWPVNSGDAQVAEAHDQAAWEEGQALNSQEQERKKRNAEGYPYARERRPEENDAWDRHVEKLRAKQGQVNEVGDTPAGKKALGSYVKKASADAKGRAYNAGYQHGDSSARKIERKPGSDWVGSEQNRKAGNRVTGIARATDRLVGEDQVNEVGDTPAGKKALGSYVKKASADAKSRGYDAGAADWGDGEGEKHPDDRTWPGAKGDAKAHKRLKGIDRAVDRMVGESKVGTGVTVILEGVRFRVSDPSLAKILRRFPHETENFNMGSELDDHLYNALFDHYSAAGEMPYGVMKARDGDPYNWVTNRLAHEMDVNESMTEDATDSGLERIMHHFSHEVEQFRQTGELDDDLYDELYDHYFDEMPYGVKKARSGDPMEWVCDRFEQDLAQDSPLAETERPLVGDAPVEPVMDESVLMEEPAEEEITQALQMVGLEDGLDFFFEGGLVVMGRSTAKVAINALRNAGVGTPKIASVDGEEVRITFNKQPAPVADPRDTQSLMAVDESLGGRGYYIVNSMTSAQEADGPFQDEQEAWDSVKASYPQQQWDNFSVVDYDKLTDLQHRENMGESVVTEGNGPSSMSDEELFAKVNSIKPGAGNALRSGLFNDPEFVELAKSKDMSDEELDSVIYTVALDIEELLGGPENVPFTIYDVDNYTGQRIWIWGPNKVASTVTEGKVKELTQDMKEMSAAEFKAKYNKTKEEWKKNLAQPKEKMDEDVNLSVSASGEEDVLNIIRKLSGMPEVAAVATAIEAPMEETVEVDTPDEGLYSNEPDQHVHTSTTDMINRGEDLNRPKRQYPQAANRAANPMAEARKLMRSYDELMKGVTK